MQVLVPRPTLRVYALLETVMNDEMPAYSKLTRSKQRRASENKFITRESDRSGHERVPASQHP